MTPKQRVSSTEQLRVGTQILTYMLIFVKRKSVGITVRPDMSVTVRAPQGISRQAVAEIVTERAPWILRHLENFSQRRANQPQEPYRLGSTYRFLGRDLPIKQNAPINVTARGEKVSLRDGVLYLNTTGINNNGKIATVLDEWSRTQAEPYFLDRMTLLFRYFDGMGLQSPTLKIRRMKARWGSCSTNGLVTLNLKLIHLDQSLIDYVIMHELCHLVEHNHSKRFYGLLTQKMPDWRERRARLNETWMP